MSLVGSAAVANVFISYARVRRELAKALEQRLEAAGLTVWWDKGLTGGDFDAEIYEQLKAASAVVVIWTRESVKADYVRAEAHFGWRKRKLVNTHLSEIDPEEDLFPFSNIHSIELEDTARIIARIRHLLSQTSMTDVELLKAQDEAAILELMARFPHAAARIAQHAKEIGRMAVDTGSITQRKRRWLRVGDDFRDLVYLPRLTIVPGGEFQMGAEDNDREARDNERPRHSVKIPRPFAVGTFPVTVGEWEEARKRGFDGRPQKRRDVYVPATHVTWPSAKAYTAWLRRETGFQYRLLSESEWEYCCRAASKEPEIETLGQFDVTYSDRIADRANDLPILARVARYSPNAFGLYDMQGTVWEWVEDDYHFTYVGAPRDGSPWNDHQPTEHKVLRGGCFASGLRHTRAARRARCTLNPREPEKVGFRVTRPV